MYLEDVKAKLKRKNQILFSKDSICLQALYSELQKHSRRTIILWALECAEQTAGELSFDPRPQDALNAAKSWAHGEIKMPVAKRAILQVHAMAKQLTNPAQIAICHAVGQACSTVHTEKHAMGLPIYELTAIVRTHGIENSEPIIENKIDYYLKTLAKCSEISNSTEIKWAEFLLKKSAESN